MNKNSFLQLPLSERVTLTRQAGTLFEVNDYYSYQIFRYVIDGEEVDVVQDFLDNVVSVELSKRDDHNMTSSV